MGENKVMLFFIGTILYNRICRFPYKSASVAQGIEQWFPKPCVAGSIPAGGVNQWYINSYRTFL